MYEILVYMFEHYASDNLDRGQLGRKLSSAGFEREDIRQALTWLDGLDHAARSVPGPAPATAPQSARPEASIRAASPDSMRVYSPHELAHLGREGIACIHFLESAGALAPELREVVIDRALAMPEPLHPDDLPVIIMMVYWRLDAETNLLVLDELCDDRAHRVPH